MTAEQKQKVLLLRQQQRSYADIAKIVNLPEGTVKSFCWRNREALLKPTEAMPGSICRSCGKPLLPQPDAPPRKYCSDKCRYDWWREHRKPNSSAVCAGCNKEFFYYGKAGRKYCNQECYIKHRFG